MSSKLRISFSLIFFLSVHLCYAQSYSANRTAYIDKNGKIRWNDNNKEVALFGANYAIASACDYRAAGYISNDRKKMVDQDMEHFARMGFDALRLCFWGDYENTDKDGNLINNDHLNMLDYVIAKAKARGIYMLLSPIVTYSSIWPDANGDTLSIKGSLASTYKKSELGTNPKAIAAECNYLKQLLNHVNPYTGIALKDEPAIIFIEMINEPWHHSSDVTGSVNYINALVNAVRSTGCKKVLFHNVSQDFDIAKAMQKSEIQGATFAWYPTGLNNGHSLTGNYLPVVDQYSSEMLRPELSKLGRIVYEFDSPDYLTGYMYPAMLRSFRRMGAQWASIFSYDMLATAPYNLGWQSHFINMVYTPAKAVSAMIAAEVMRQIPMYKDYGNYPQNTSFGPFLVSYDQNLGLLNDGQKYYYTNTTDIEPKNLSLLKRIAGHGSSPVVQYEGEGIYFLDKINSDTWRLEVYPDAVIVEDPFKMPSPGKVVSRLIHHVWPMRVNLDALGKSFTVTPIDSNNTYFTKAIDGKFDIKPGVYLLSTKSEINKKIFSQRVGNFKLNEFICPSDEKLPTQVIVDSTQNFEENKPVIINAKVYSATDPDEVTLFVKTANRRYYMPVKMKRTTGYNYQATVFNAGAGMLEYEIVVKEGSQITNYPSRLHISPWDWNYYGATAWHAKVMPAHGILDLLEPSVDLEKMSFTRIDDGIRTGVFKTIVSPETGNEAIQLELPLSYDRNLDDYTVSVPVKEHIIQTKDYLSDRDSIVFVTKGIAQKQEALLTLVENDGTSWSIKMPLSGSWQTIALPLSAFKLGRGVKLPLGYPGRWDYWFTPAVGRGTGNDMVHIKNVEFVQISMRPSQNQPTTATQSSYVDVEKVYLKYNKVR